MEELFDEPISTRTRNANKNLFRSLSVESIMVTPDIDGLVESTKENEPMDNQGRRSQNSVTENTKEQEGEGRTEGNESIVVIENIEQRKMAGDCVMDMLAKLMQQMKQGQDELSKKMDERCTKLEQGQEQMDEKIDRRMKEMIDKLENKINDNITRQLKETEERMGRQLNQMEIKFNEQIEERCTRSERKVIEEMATSNLVMEERLRKDFEEGCNKRYLESEKEIEDKIHREVIKEVETRVMTREKEVTKELEQVERELKIIEGKLEVNKQENQELRKMIDSKIKEATIGNTRETEKSIKRIEEGVHEKYGRRIENKMAEFEKIFDDKLKVGWEERESKGVKEIKKDYDQMKNKVGSIAEELAKDKEIIWRIEEERRKEKEERKKHEENKEKERERLIDLIKRE